MTEHTRSVDPQVGAGRHPLCKICAPARRCTNPGTDRVGSYNIRSEHGPPGDLENRCATLVDAIRNLVGGDIGSQWTGFQRRGGPDRTGRQGPIDVGNVRIGNGVVHQDLHVNRLADCHGGQAARALHARQSVVVYFLRRQGPQGNLPLQCRRCRQRCCRCHGPDGHHRNRQKKNRCSLGCCFHVDVSLSEVCPIMGVRMPPVEFRPSVTC
jgi:hypothetical protein